MSTSLSILPIYCKTNTPSNKNSNFSLNHLICRLDVNLFINTDKYLSCHHICICFMLFLKTTSLTKKGTIKLCNYNLQRHGTSPQIRCPIRTHRSLVKLRGIYVSPFQRHLFSQHNNIISITYIHLQIMSKTCNIMTLISRPVDPHFEPLVTHAYVGFN